MNTNQYNLIGVFFMAPYEELFGASECDASTSPEYHENMINGNIMNMMVICSPQAIVFKRGNH